MFLLTVLEYCMYTCSQWIFGGWGVFAVCVWPFPPSPPPTHHHRTHSKGSPLTPPHPPPHPHPPVCLLRSTPPPPPPPTPHPLPPLPENDGNGQNIDWWSLTEEKVPECEAHTAQSGWLVSHSVLAYTMSVALCAVGLLLRLSFVATPRVASH